jgi:TPR repeat protein
VPQDYLKAREWYEQAVNRGDAAAMRMIALLYANGAGVPQDYGKAREWYVKAAAFGDVEAIINLGFLYYNGQGVPQDFVKAREWYEKAAASGNIGVMTTIGLMYANGLGVSEDYAKAQEWLEKAASGGNAEAMNHLGSLYAEGLGVPRNLAKAREWYEKAAGMGDPSGLGNLAWEAVLARDPELALNAADSALQRRPDLLWIESNRALALMYLGRAVEARTLFLSHKGKVLPDRDKLWEQVIGKDFEALRKAGIEHPQMAEIEAALGIEGR